MTKHTVDASLAPKGSLEILSQLEVNALLDTSANGLYDVYRRCSLAVLNCGSHTDDTKEIFELYRDFQIRLEQQDRGVRLELSHAPAAAFVDGKVIKGIREHLFAVLRDIIYLDNEIHGSGKFDLNESAHITSAVFHILRNANVLKVGSSPNIVVCWGGHSISRHEYEYSKIVGHEMGLRGLDICTGCGPGAMKGPMKGAAIGHSKQRIPAGRYIGLSEPSIIAAESPNPIVNELVILPDIEKRLEAFVRLGHGVVVFPGGAGTAEEILYLLGILLHPDNRDQPLPLVLTGPASSEAYFEQIDAFIADTIGPAAQARYEIVIDDPRRVARLMQQGLSAVREFRVTGKDAFYYNWLLRIDPMFQSAFEVTHEAMATLALHHRQAPHVLAANLRRAFSGIVAGNIKEAGVNAIEKLGPFEVTGDAQVLGPMDDLLAAFVSQNRMKLHGADYNPCYRLLG